jgi:hypothetical protein
MWRRWTAFILGAIGALVGGGWLAEVAWCQFHHRYEQPGKGFYRNVVDARFSQLTITGAERPIFNLSFKGETPRRWTWNLDSVRYNQLMVSWNGELSEGTAEVSLPSMSYNRDGSTGTVTRELLASWLGGASEPSDASAFTQAVDAIYGYVVAAGQGTLPSPRHHGIHVEEPVHGSIYHFSFGPGVASWVYWWALIWLVAVIIVGRRLTSVWHKPRNHALVNS